MLYLNCKTSVSLMLSCMDGNTAETCILDLILLTNVNNLTRLGLSRLFKYLQVIYLQLFAGKGI